MIEHRTRPRGFAVTLLIIALLVPAVSVSAGGSKTKQKAPEVELLTSGLSGASGSTIGPGGHLYVTEGATGEVTKVNRRTGAKSTYASGLPPALIGIGGAVDVEFIGRTAYVLVTLVGSDVGGTDTVGIYRVDGPSSLTVIADIGAFSEANPPDTDFFLPTGVQYAIERYRGGFLVTDGHHNRVLRVKRNGHISEFKTFGNIVPTGLDVRGSRVYMAEAGPVPHLPEDGKIVSFTSRSRVREVAAGGRLLVDVEFGRGNRLYGLAQGYFTPGQPDGSPADPDTGELLRVRRNGSFKVIAEGLDQPTSVEIVRNTAYVTTLGGEIWTVSPLGH